MDFAVSKDGQFMKVQVKTASWSRTGRHEYLNVRLSSSNPRGRYMYQPGDFDFLFVIEPGVRQWLIPFAEVVHLTSVNLGRRGPGTQMVSRKSYNPEAWCVLS